ncbi:MAG: HD-GYP domain-containing protein [Syntrophaceae bacterium]|nr:HD-GYP domain-containing protein [Syntrophaceae bacterium]
MDIIQFTTQPKRVNPKSGDGMDPVLSKWGNNLVTKFHVLMRISQIYDSKNVAIQQFVQECLEAINTLVQREGPLSLKVIRNDFFLNGQRLRYSVEGFTSFKYLLTQWKKKLIGEVIFNSLVDEGMLKHFIYTLMELEEGRQENANLFNEALARNRILTIVVNPLEIVEGEEESFTFQKEDQREVGKKVFFETIGTIKEVITQIKGRQRADIRKLKRLAQKAVHLVIEDESILLGMTTIKNYDEYTFNHSVNVSIYSLAMGKRLGFSKKTLTELGITALFHDIGKSKIPIDVLNKPASLSDDEWGMMKKHPLMGVEIVLNLKQLGEINPRMVIGIFDHHLKNDFSGYPKLFRKKEISLFGRIIQIVDSYDAMTTPRIYKKVPYTPEQALAIMLKERTVHFDPILLKIFIGLVGIYPIGSLVLLNTHEMGIVYKPSHDPRWLDRPIVLLVDRGKEGEAKKEVVDLTETDGMGRYKRSIVKTLDPFKYHIDIAKYFL